MSYLTDALFFLIFRDKAYTLRPDRHQAELPVGFDLSSDPVSVQDMSHFRFRQDDGKRVDPAAAVRS